jgi:dihydroxy-acid dehydratase
MTKCRSSFESGTHAGLCAKRSVVPSAFLIPTWKRPKIAMINSSSELSICFSHLDEVAAMVKQAVREAGGLPLETKTTAPSDFITGAGHGGRYLKASRGLLVNDIEVAVEGAVFDGMACLSSCDKTAPAHMMAAALPE